MEKIFTDKVATITGGSFDMRSATAVAFAKPGGNVVIADRIPDELT